jgi:hypothetical protein
VAAYSVPSEQDGSCIIVVAESTIVRRQVFEGLRMVAGTSG